MDQIPSVPGSVALGERHLALVVPSLRVLRNLPPPVIDPSTKFMCAAQPAPYGDRTQYHVCVS